MTYIFIILIICILFLFNKNTEKFFLNFPNKKIKCKCNIKKKPKKKIINIENFQNNINIPKDNKFSNYIKPKTENNKYPTAQQYFEKNLNCDYPFIPKKKKNNKYNAYNYFDYNNIGNNTDIIFKDDTRYENLNLFTIGIPSRY